MRNEPEKLAWSGCCLLFDDYNGEQSRILLCYFDLRLLQNCRLDVGWASAHQFGGASPTLPRKNRLLITCILQNSYFDFSHTTLTTGGRARRPD